MTGTHRMMAFGRRYFFEQGASVFCCMTVELVFRIRNQEEVLRRDCRDTGNIP